MAGAEPPLVTYRGNCHCGAIIFEAQLPELTTAYECNCSICSKKGYLWQFPGERRFKVVKGDLETTLTTYKFGGLNYLHKFCPNCGTPVMAFRKDGPPERHIGVNIRVLQGVSAWSLKTSSVNKAAIPPAYEPPGFTGSEPAADLDGGKIYHGSCHCGAVKIAVKVKPLDETYDDRIIEGDCSSCSRGAYIWIYPRTNQVSIDGRENLNYYVFATTVWRKAFCKKCGVHIMNEINPKTDEEIAALPEKDQLWRKRLIDFSPVTLRCLNDVEWSKLKTTRHNCATILLPEYVNP